MHLNPNVHQAYTRGIWRKPQWLGNMFFIEPLEYLSFVYLMDKAHIVLTDSGGIQEEARDWEAGTGDARYYRTP